MPKHRISRTRTMSIQVSVAYEVEFDTETGIAEVVGHGRVESFPETVRRRAIQADYDAEQEDTDALAELIDQGLVTAPKPGETIMLSDVEKFLDADDYESHFDDGELAENYTIGKAVVNSLVSKEFARIRRRLKRRHGR